MADGILKGIIERPEQFIVTLVIGLIIFQILSYLISFAYPPAGDIKLGWAVLLLAMALSVYGAFLILRSRFLESRAFSRGDLFVIFVISAAMVAVFVYVPNMLPQVFSVAGQQLQSIIGLPIG